LIVVQFKAVHQLNCIIKGRKINSQESNSIILAQVVYMNKFQKLSQINKDIEILEASGKFESATVLHNNFLKISNVEPLDPSVDPSIDIVPPSNYPYLRRPNPQTVPSNPQNLNEKYFQSIESILSSNSPYKFDQAYKVFDKLLKIYPMPPSPRYMSDKETPEFQRAYKKWEEITYSITGRYQSLIQKYKHNPRPDLEGTKNDIFAKSTPEQAQNSAILQAKWKTIWKSKMLRAEKYKELMKVHQTAEQFLEQGKISRAGVQTFRDLMLQTESINYPYPMPGDPGFKPEII